MNNADFMKVSSKH